MLKLIEQYRVTWIQVVPTMLQRVWRLADESGHAMNIRVYDDPRILPNLTLWENVEALERFVWQTLHRRFYLRREEWFEKIEQPLVLWWVPAGYRPAMSEGVERLGRRDVAGPTHAAVPGVRRAGVVAASPGRGWRSSPEVCPGAAARTRRTPRHAWRGRPPVGLRSPRRGCPRRG